jgi:hypothetical protein
VLYSVIPWIGVPRLPADDVGSHDRVDLTPRPEPWGYERWVSVFGRVPFFYYLLHIPLIHAIALVVSAVRLGEVSPWLFTNHPMRNPPAPKAYTWGVGLLYAVWAAVVVGRYFPCRWFGELKARGKSGGSAIYEGLSYDSGSSLPSRSRCFATRC